MSYPTSALNRTPAEFRARCDENFLQFAPPAALHHLIAGVRALRAGDLDTASTSILDGCALAKMVVVRCDTTSSRRLVEIGDRLLARLAVATLARDLALERAAREALERARRTLEVSGITEIRRVAHRTPRYLVRRVAATYTDWGALMAVVEVADAVEPGVRVDLAGPDDALPEGTVVYRCRQK